MAYYSRGYLAEKWTQAKRSMEDYLRILDQNEPDQIEEKKVERVAWSIEDALESIILELNKK